MSREHLFSVTKKDLKITYFSGHGAGGQHRNRHNNCVRIHHPDSGATATGQDSRSLEQNKKIAFKRLTQNPVFKNWLKVKASEATIDMNKIKRDVEEAMREENLRIEYPS